jgi:hypothetical protein
MPDNARSLPVISSPATPPTRPRPEASGEPRWRTPTPGDPFVKVPVVGDSQTFVAEHGTMRSGWFRLLPGIPACRTRSFSVEAAASSLSISTKSEESSGSRPAVLQDDRPRLLPRPQASGSVPPETRASELRTRALAARNLQSRCSIKLVLSDEAFGLSQGGATRHAAPALAPTRYDRR